MKLRILYLYNLLIEFIYQNPIKSVFLIITAVSYYFAGSFPNYMVETKIEKSVQVEHGWVYLSHTIKNNQNNYDMIFSETPLQIKDGVYSYSSYHGANVFFWICFFLFAIILAVSSFIDEDDINWEWSDVKRSALSRMIRCEYENGEYIYFIGDYLMGIERQQIPKFSYATNHYNLYRLSDIKLKPKYQSKTRRRQSALEKLGIF